MKIYTSCYANLRNIPDTITPVSIARFSPKWFAGHKMKSLAPPKKLLWDAKAGRITDKEYTALFMEELKKAYTPEILYENLEKDFNGKDIVLLCYEKKGVFCHRRLVAEWIEKGVGMEVVEW